MTDIHEHAARLYCKATGTDPDEIVGHSVPGSGAWHKSSRWRLVAAELRDLDLRNECIRLAKVNPPPEDA